MYLLNLSRGDPDGHRLLNGKLPEDDGIPTDPLASLQTRLSMQARRSMDRHRRSSSITFSPGGAHRRHASHENTGLMHNYDVEQSAFGLTDLVEDPDEIEQGGRRMNGNASMPVYHDRPPRKSVDK